MFIGDTDTMLLLVIVQSSGPTHTENTEQFGPNQGLVLLRPYSHYPSLAIRHRKHSDVCVWWDVKPYSINQ